MLLQFSVENFRSFRDLHTLSLVPSKSEKRLQNHVLEKGKYRALRAVGLYGANASGKSNFLKALSAMAKLVNTSATSHTQGTQIEAYEPYLLDTKTQSAPTYFDIDFVAKDGNRYVYYFSFTAEQIIEEELVVYKTSQPARVFYRNEKAEVKKGSAYKGAFKSVKEKLLKNQLFLSKAAQDNVGIALTASFFFTSFLSDPHIHYFRAGLDNFEARMNVPESEKILVHYLPLMSSLFSTLDTGVEQVTFSASSETGNKKNVYTKHTTYDNGKAISPTQFKMSEESEGTQNLIGIIFLILSGLHLGSIIAIDEIELNLHPHICAYLVGLFNSPETNPNGAQLLFSTHDATLLDRTRLRRDQVWLTQKEAQGESILFCINAFKDLKPDTPFGAWYLAGKLGGTPIINDARFIEKLTALLKENGEKK